MDTKRLMLFIVFAMSVYFLMAEWHIEGAQVRPPSVQPTAANPAAVPAPSVSQAPSATPPAGGAEKLQHGEVVRVETDLLVAEIDTAGADLRSLELLAHQDAVDNTKHFMLLQVGPERMEIAQSGLIGGGLPNHFTRYSTTDSNLKLAPGADSVVLRLTAPAVNGVQATKTYTFHRGSYVIDVGYQVENLGAAPIAPDAYFQLVRDSVPPVGDSKMLPTYTGMAVYTDQAKFQKIAFSDVDKGKIAYPTKSNDGWIAFLQHYFLSAWLPADGAPREFYTRRLSSGTYAAGVILSMGNIEPQQSRMLTVPLYAGPQEQDKLARLAPGLDLTVDYGWLTVIAKPLFWFLQWLHQWVKNWGLAIIILTMAIKAVFYPLSATSYRSMARMRVMAPRIQRLKEQYGDDRTRLNQAMMELYKKEQINPLGGCLPVVVQIPVFIALYWVLLASVELRQAPFMLWIHDLSAQDPYYVLPVLMGATMIFQTYLNPVPPDPVQAKVMKIMPIAFSIMFFFFPAGLVLYWVVNNVLSIAQQWYVMRSVEEAKTAAHGK